MGRRHRGIQDRNFIDSALLNDLTYQFYYNRLKELAISIFDWQNLPHSIDPRFLELELYEKGQAVWFEDKDLSLFGEKSTYLALSCMTKGKFDVYRNPIGRTAIGNNGYNKELNSNNSIIIYNNLLRTNTQDMIKQYAYRLYLIQRVIDVNINAQKTPLIITCDESQRLTLLNLYKQYEGNEPFIFGDRNLDVRSIQVLNTGAPMIAEQLDKQRTTVWNDALTFLGITNVNIQKRERLLNDEVARNMGGTITSRFSKLQARQQACEQINKMFGLNIWVEYKDDIEVLDDNIIDDIDNQESKTNPEDKVISKGGDK
jgi:hypothetical protein